MAVFTLDELRNLPQEKIFLAEIDDSSMNDLENLHREFAIMQEEEERYQKLWPHRAEDLRALYEAMRLDLFLHDNVHPTILYMDGEQVIDLLENKKMEDPFVLDVCPIQFYLDEQPLQFGIVYQIAPFKCFARVNDMRFSYFDEREQDCFAGPLLREFAYHYYQNNQQILSQEQCDLQAAIRMNEERELVVTQTMARKSIGLNPYFENDVLQQLDKNQFYCAIISYLEPTRAIPIEDEHAAVQEMEQEYAIAKDKMEHQRSFFIQYKKQRERDERRTNRNEFNRRRKWYEESTETYLALEAQRNNYLQCCQFASTILYPTEEGWIDLYANQKLEDTNAVLLEETLQPISAYCEPENVEIKLQRSPFDKSYLISLKQPVVTIQTEVNTYQGALLNVIAKCYYDRRYQQELKTLVQEKVKKR